MTTLEIFGKFVTNKIINPERKGGQTCGLPQQKVRLTCEHFNLCVEVGTYRSQIKNYELAKEIMILMIDEVKG